MADIVNQSKDFSQILCSFCGLFQKKETAVSRCVTCLDFLCDTCAKSRHTFTRQTRNHKIVSLSDIKTGMYDSEIRSRQKMHCPKHVYETLQMYCIQCDLCVCVECVVLDHKQHALQSLFEARKVKEFKIQKALEAVQEKHEKIIQHKLTLSMHVKDISDKKAVLKNRINKTCREALKNIIGIERKAKEELGNLFRPEEDIIQTSIDNCTAICTRLEETIHASKDILRNANDIDVLILCNDIIKQTECDSEDFQLPLEKIPDLQITWKESEMKLFVEKIPVAIGIDQKEKLCTNASLSQTKNAVVRGEDKLVKETNITKTQAKNGSVHETINVMPKTTDNTVNETKTIDTTTTTQVVNETKSANVDTTDVYVIKKERMNTKTQGVAKERTTTKTKTTEAPEDKIDFKTTNTAYKETKSNQTKTKSTSTRNKYVCQEQCLGLKKKLQPISSPRVATYEIDLIDTLAFEDSTDHFKPVFSSVAWIDSQNIAVVDKGNEKLKTLNLKNRASSSHSVPGISTVDTCRMGLACKSKNRSVAVFKIPFAKIKNLNVNNASCVVSSASDQPSLKWITNWKLLSYEQSHVCHISFFNTAKQAGVLDIPTSAFCCSDGTYIFSDRKTNCVYFILNEGVNILKIDHFPGSISENKNKDIFISDFEKGTVSVFNCNGIWQSEIKIGKGLYSPRSISILGDRLLVVTKFEILLFEMKKIK